MKRKHDILLIGCIIVLFSILILQLVLLATGQKNTIKSLAQVFMDTGASEPALQLNWYQPPTVTPSPTPTIPPTPTLVGSIPPAAPEPAAGGNQDVVALARKQIGKMYLWGAPTRNWAAAGADPKNFDCSGLVGWAWHTATGGKVKMAGQTSADWNDSSGKYQKFTPADIDKIQPGDLVYFTVGRIHHVGMYSGSGCGDSRCFIDAPASGKPVRESSLNVRNASNDPMIGFLRPIVK